jgi:initiation factor 1A
LIFKEDGQEYAQVTKMLGNGRLEALCFDGTKRLCHIRGKLRKKVSPDDCCDTLNLTLTLRFYYVIGLDQPG